MKRRLLIRHNPTATTLSSPVSLENCLFFFNSLMFALNPAQSS